MKIHSDFRDYYDIGLSVGVDTSLHYNRKRRGVYHPDLKAPFPPETFSQVRRARNKDAPDVERALVGFCGVIYPCIRILRGNTDVNNIYVPQKLDEHFKCAVPPWGRPSEHWERRFRKEQRERERFLLNRPRCDELFIEMDAPVFIVREDEDERGMINIIANESLREFEFVKVIDPYSAFQEISMYLGNQLVKHDEPDEIADEYRIAMHGYDKNSFRHPTRVAKL